MHATDHPGIPAGYAPAPPPVLPSDPDELVAAIMDPDRRGELYPLYHALRRAAPVHHSTGGPLGDAWVVTRFADAERLYRDSSAIIDAATAETFNHGGGAFYRMMAKMLIFMEPEAHARTRSLVVRAFTPRAIGTLRPIAQSIADRLADAVTAAGQMDLVSQYAYLLPVKVIAHILGVPDADGPLIERLAWDFARAGEQIVDPAVAARGDAAAEGFADYFDHLIARRRADPGDDVVSALLAAEEAGQRLSHDEIVSTCVLLLQAGHETTADLIGNGTVALFRHPDQLQLLRSDPDLLRPAVEEILRYDGSVQVNHRTLLRDVEVGGTTIPAGAEVYIFVGAVNRDPDRFEDPDRLRIGRPIDHHLAFAFGTYYCIGASLARTEAQVGLGTLLGRFPGLRPATDGFTWRDTLRLRGPRELLVAW